MQTKSSIVINSITPFLGTEVGGVDADKVKLWGLIFGSVLLNLASQGALIANQVKVYSLDSQSRSRINTVVMVATFIGASIGSMVGSYGWSIAQWTGVCFAGLLLISIAVIQFLLANINDTY